MEFDNGSRCSAELCHQHDFLPFTCDVCHKTFCLQHRVYSAHNCEAAALKDMTSLDCPVCGVSVKFNRSQNIDAIWADHSLNYCKNNKSGNIAPRTTTTAMTTSSQKKKCARGDCITLLGPSNTYQCPKCFKNVCLAHRLAEEHNCSAAVSVKTLRNEKFLSRFEQKSPAKKSTVSTTDSSNTLKGSAHRRMQGPTTSSSNPPPPSPLPSDSEVSLCPLCGMAFPDASLLIPHFETFHPDPTGSNTPPSFSRPPPVPSPTPGTGGEKCPHCQLSFPDPVSLVEHFEAAHPSPPPNSSPSSECSVG